MANDKRLCMGCMNEIEGNGPCSVCGYNDATDKNSPDFLPTHTLIANRYIVGAVIESNGEGVTYKGYDCNTDTPVRIREYCPTNLCKRDSKGRVMANIGDEGPFESGMIAFEDLAKSLSHLNDLPALVPVTDFFKENGTVYYITETFVGITLREFLMRNNGALKWEQIKPLFLPIMSTVKALHSAGIVHMGISPETVMVCRDGRLRLVGFCIKEARTARNSINGQLYPGFAAIEQYGTQGEQGPWTDVYGFAATIYRTLVGTPPMEATERVTNDNMTIPSKVAETLPKQVMVALANALEILPEDRTQSMTELRSELLLSDTGTVVVAPAKGKGEVNKSSNKKRKGVGVLYGLIAALATAIVLLVIVLIFWEQIVGTLGLNKGDETSSIISTSSTVSVDPNVPCTVPDLLHYDYNEVMNHPDVYAPNFNVEVVKFDYSKDGYASNEIYKQIPEKGTIANKGSTIQIYVSLGPELVKMPELKGMTVEEASAALSALGFAPNSIIIESEGSVAGYLPGTIFYYWTDPAVDAEGKVSPESTVYVRRIPLSEDDTQTPSVPATPEVTQ